MECSLFAQELIFTHKQVKAHGLFLTFYQFVLYSLFALFEARLSNIGERRIPLATYVVISFLTVATMALSNSSLTYLNYPTQVRVSELISLRLDKLNDGNYLYGHPFNMESYEEQRVVQANRVYCI